MAILFPEALWDFLEVWVGPGVARGDEDRGYASHYGYLELRDQLLDLERSMEGALAQIKAGLPPQVAASFARATHTFVGGESSTLRQFAQEVERIAR